MPLPLVMLVLGALAQDPADAAPAVEPAGDSAGVEFFETRVRPVLAERCGRCHGERRQRSDLRLDTYGAILRGGERGPAVVPGDPGASLLIRAISYADEELEMPPKGKLPDGLIDDLTRWVAMGAPGPEETWDTTEDGAGDAGAGDFDLEARKAHWSFQPIADPAVPEVGPWPGAPEGVALGAVDRFVLARLEAAGLAPAAQADPRTLVRRLSFDLTGLPPTPEEVEAFVAESAADFDAAWGRLVDRLLASPAFGETWGRHWLDLVRYAETKGHEFDHVIPNAWEYRDYVIRAWNADVPYDRFVREHVAGDLLPEPRPHPEGGWDESVLGTGFWFLHEETHSPVDVRADQCERIANQIDVFSKSFLGLTVACARCHDHKFDPITQEDYYALAGYLQSSSYRQVRFEASEANGRAVADLERWRAENATEATRMLASRLGELAAGVAEGLESGAWDAELEVAAQDPLHLLHPYALARGADDVPAALASLDARQAELGEELRRFLADAQVLADYSRPGTPWIQDGPTFGSGPVPAGRLRASIDPRRPAERIAVRTAAEADPLWSARRLADGTQVEDSAIDWVQAGRVLRTPTVTLARDRVYALVRGSGRAFAAVDSHRMVKGPLHGRTVVRWSSEDLRWIELDLADYRGHRVHVEFSPDWEPGAAAVDDAFGVVRVVASDVAPPGPRQPNSLLRERIASGRIRSAAGLAEAYENVFRGLARGVATSGLAEGPAEGPTEGPRAEEAAELLDWLLRHGDDPVRRTLPTAPVPLTLTSRAAPALLDGTGVDENLLVRGSPGSPADPVPRRFLEALGGREDPRPTAGSGRLALAERMCDPANPLTARVQVNRLWKHLFGRGLVASVDNFGVSGEAPTHPDLLDSLATDFVRGGWSNKGMLRSMVLSRTYRMASAGDPAAEEADPANLLLHRMPVRRLGAEAIRDAILAVSGTLDRTPYGPPVPVHLTEFLDGRGRPGASGPLDGNGRRSIYQAVRRNFLPPLLQVFDFPTPATTRGRRSVSNVPAQALALMNDPFVAQEAERWAERVSELPPAERVPAMVRAAYGREPLPEELDLLATVEPVEAAHVLFNTKEFLFLR